MSEEPVLYAEDEEHDVLFMQRAFERAGVQNPLVIVENGQVAIDYLEAAAGKVPLALPRLVLLDLNMPLKSGLEVLKWIRTQPATCALPVVVLSSSDQDSDIHRAYTEGVNGYLVKPGNPKELEAMVRALKDFWLTYNRATSGQHAIPEWRSEQKR